jgi:hypothetical protein
MVDENDMLKLVLDSLNHLVVNQFLQERRQEKQRSGQLNSLYQEELKTNII